MPPIAPTPGRIIFRLSESSPSISSLFNSRPTRKKNIAINPSLIQSNNGFAISKAPIRISTGVSRNNA